MGERLPICEDDRLNVERESTQGGASLSSSMNSVSGPSHQYEGLMGDSLPCPSCSGSGRIPKEQESALIALIPANDSRLKPRRTWLYVGSVVTGCLLVSGLLFFFLLPRSVTVSPLSGPIQHTDITTHIKKTLIVMNFVAPISVDNWNYYSVKVVNATGQVFSKVNPFQREVIGSGVNLTEVSLPIHSTGNLVNINYTVTLKPDTGVGYCDFWLSSRLAYLGMDFEVSIFLEYLGHQESSGIQKVTRQVCCGNDGNCTQSFEDNSFFRPVILK